MKSGKKRSAPIRPKIVLIFPEHTTTTPLRFGDGFGTICVFLLNSLLLCVRSLLFWCVVHAYFCNFSVNFVWCSGRSRISRRVGGVDLRRGRFSVKMFTKVKELGPVGWGRAPELFVCRSATVMSCYTDSCISPKVVTAHGRCQLYVHVITMGESGSVYRRPKSWDLTRCLPRGWLILSSRISDKNVLERKKKRGKTQVTVQIPFCMAEKCPTFKVGVRQVWTHIFDIKELQWPYFNMRFRDKHTLSPSHPGFITVNLGPTNCGGGGTLPLHWPGIKQPQSTQRTGDCRRYLKN